MGRVTYNWVDITDEFFEAIKGTVKLYWQFSIQCNLFDFLSYFIVFFLIL